MILTSFRLLTLIFVFMSLVMQAHASSILSVGSWSETVVDHPSRADGWYLHLAATISDPLGVPGNITSVSVTDINGVDPGSYTLNYRTDKLDYATHSPFPVSEGSGALQYQFSVINNQNEVVTALDNPIDTIRQLEGIQNIALSDFGTTPTFSFDAVQFADNYRMVIASGDNTQNIWFSDWEAMISPSFTVPLGVLQAGNSYYFRAEAGDFNTLDLDGVDDLENKSLRFFDVTIVPVPAAVWLFGSGLIGLIGIARRKKA